MKLFFPDIPRLSFSLHFILLDNRSVKGQTFRILPVGYHRSSCMRPNRQKMRWRQRECRSTWKLMAMKVWLKSVGLYLWVIYEIWKTRFDYPYLPGRPPPAHTHKHKCRLLPFFNGSVTQPWNIHAEHWKINASAERSRSWRKRSWLFRETFSHDERDRRLESSHCLRKK